MTSLEQATLYRMVTGQHICPFGLKSRDLLERGGFAADDHRLTSRADQMRSWRSNTPQTFIAGKRIGGYDGLRRHLDKPMRDPEAVTCQPVVAVFGMAALMVLAANWAAFGTLLSVHAG